MDCSDLDLVNPPPRCGGRPALPCRRAGEVGSDLRPRGGSRTLALRGTSRSATCLGGHDAPCRDDASSPGTRDCRISRGPRSAIDLGGDEGARRTGEGERTPRFASGKGRPARGDWAHPVR